MCCAGERFIFAKDKSEFAAEAHAFYFDGLEQAVALVIADIGTWQKAHSEPCSDETLQQFAGIDFHGDAGLNIVAAEDIVDLFPLTSMLGQQKGILQYLGEFDLVARCERVGLGDDQDQIVLVNDVHRQADVFYGKGDDAEIDFAVEDGFKRASAVGADDVQIDARVLLLELSEDRGQNIKAGSLIGANGDLSARRAVQLADGHHNVAVDLKAVLGERLEESTCGSECNLAAVAVKEARASLVLQGAYLCGDCWLGDAELLSGTGKAFQSAYFQEGS